MEQFPQPWKGKRSRYYQFTYTRSDEIRVSKRTRCLTKRMARVFIQDFMEELEASRKRPGVSLKEFCKPYYVWETCSLVRFRLDEKKSMGIEHVRSQRGRLENYVLSDPIGNIPLIKLMRGDLLDWRSRIRKEHTDGPDSRLLV